MTDSALDPLLERAIDALRALPSLDQARVSRIVSAAAAARLNAAEDDASVAAPLRSTMPWPWIIGVAAAAALIGFVARGALVSRHRVESRVAPVVLSPQAISIARAANGRGDAESMPIPKQFVLDNAHAARVALVGDFNEWNPTAAPLTRDVVSGLWTIVVSIPPGRHMYAFVVDDSVFTLDPRAPKVKDPALGAEGSVVIVGKP